MTIARTVLLTIILVGVSARADEVEDLLRAEMATQHIPGLAVALVKEGKILKRLSYGLANVEYGVPVTPKTVFKLASVSKQMLAVGIMLLARDGELSIDDRIDDFHLHDSDPMPNFRSSRQNPEKSFTLLFV